MHGTQTHSTATDARQKVSGNQVLYKQKHNNNNGNQSESGGICV